MMREGKPWQTSSVKTLTGAKGVEEEEAAATAAAAAEVHIFRVVGSNGHTLLPGPRRVPGEAEQEQTRTDRLTAFFAPVCGLDPAIGSLLSVTRTPRF